MAKQPVGMTCSQADAELKQARDALAYAKENKAPRQTIKDLQKAVRNLF